jgi:hypothetical protein
VLEGACEAAEKSFSWGVKHQQSCRPASVQTFATYHLLPAPEADGPASAPTTKSFAFRGLASDGHVRLLSLTSLEVAAAKKDQASRSARLSTSSGLRPRPAALAPLFVSLEGNGPSRGMEGSLETLAIREEPLGW